MQEKGNLILLIHYYRVIEYRKVNTFIPAAAAAARASSRRTVCVVMMAPHSPLVLWFWSLLLIYLATIATNTLIPQETSYVASAFIRYTIWFMRHFFSTSDCVLPRSNFLVIVLFLFFEQ